MILFGSSVVGLAQQKKPAKVSPPPSANDYFPERWKEFSSKDGTFKILFPGTPKESTIDDNAAPDSYPTYYASYKSFLSYSALYVEYDEDIENPAAAKQAFDRARNSALSTATQLRESPRIIKEEDISVEGHPGRFLQMGLSNNKAVWIKFVVVKNRFYYLQVEMLNGPSRTCNDYEKIAMRFLDSFRLIVK
jgi:hypothetical protein